MYLIPNTSQYLIVKTQNSMWLILISWKKKHKAESRAVFLNSFNYKYTWFIQDNSTTTKQHETYDLT